MTNKITFLNKTNDYNEWADAIWNKGFNLSIEDVKTKLQVSSSWINHVLLENIKYVVYEPKYIWDKTKKNNQTFINKDELNNFIKREGRFTKQTEIVDLYSYLPRKKANKYLNLYRELRKNSKDDLNFGTVPRKFLEILNKDFIINFEPKNLSCTKRKDIPEIDVDKFDIFDKNLWFPRDNTLEKSYRQAFLNGDIKITIGNKKTLFIKNNANYNNYKIPFLIPYGKKIIIR